MRVLLTGATGFIGSTVLDEIVRENNHVPIVVTRLPMQKKSQGTESYETGDFCDVTDWSVYLHEVDVVVHMAGRAHVIVEDELEPLYQFRRINVDVTISLAKQAAQLGVKRFIFLSSIGANGASSGDAAFTENSPYAPHSDYAVSKMEAEIALLDLTKNSEMEVVILRPPLVYGADASGNFGKLLTILNRGVPLPFRALNNKRSMISRENLVSIILACIDHPNAGNEIFLVADGQDLSTAELMQALSIGMGSKTMLFSVPRNLLKILLFVCKKQSTYIQLCQSLRIDNSKSSMKLGWVPNNTSVDGLMMAGKKYRLKK